MEATRKMVFPSVQLVPWVRAEFTPIRIIPESFSINSTNSGTVRKLTAALKRAFSTVPTGLRPSKSRSKADLAVA